MNALTHVEVANTIKHQLDHKALFMLGASNFCAAKTENDESYLSFKIGRNDKGVTHIRVVLQSNDTYRLEFIRIWAYKYTDKGKVLGAYAEDMHSIIEEHTGMRTSL